MTNHSPKWSPFRAWRIRAWKSAPNSKTFPRKKTTARPGSSRANVFFKTKSPLSSSICRVRTPLPIPASSYWTLWTSSNSDSLPCRRRSRQRRIGDSSTSSAPSSRASNCPLPFVSTQSCSSTKTSRNYRGFRNSNCFQGRKACKKPIGRFGTSC